APAAVPDAPPPAAQASDPQARTVLEGVSRDPNLRGWLGQSELLRRWAVVLDNLAEGVLPRRDLAFLTPEREFSAVRINGKLFIDPKSEARWEPLAAAIGSVDAQAFAKAVHTLHPMLEAS